MDPEKGTRVHSVTAVKYGAAAKVKHGTVTGHLKGFTLIRWDGLDRDYGYLPNEYEVVRDETAD